MGTDGNFVDGYCVATYCIELCHLLLGERGSEQLVLLPFNVSGEVSLSWEQILWPIRDTGWYAEWEVLFSLDRCGRALRRHSVAI